MSLRDPIRSGRPRQLLAALCGALALLAWSAPGQAQEKVLHYTGLPANDISNRRLLMEMPGPFQNVKEAAAELTVNLTSGKVAGSVRLMAVKEPEEPGVRIGWANRLTLTGKVLRQPGDDTSDKPFLEGTFVDDYRQSKGEWVGYLNDPSNRVVNQYSFVHDGKDISYKTSYVDADKNIKWQHEHDWITIYQKEENREVTALTHIYARVYAGAAPPTRATFQVKLITPRPITSKMIDEYLDHLGGHLQMAADAPSSGRSLTPIECDQPEPDVVTASGVPDWVQAAELARAVYEQVRSLQTLSSRQLILPLTKEQKGRAKAFLHWVDWIQKRGHYNVRQFGNAGKLYWQLEVQRGENLERPWEEFPPRPTYPFVGPVGDVPPPNLREIVDEPDAMIYREEYGAAFVKTVVEWTETGAVSYFTFGLMSSSYLYLAGKTTSPLALAVLSGVYRAGPLMVAIHENYKALSNWKKLSWDQRAGRLATIFLAAVHAANAPPKLPDVGRGLNESPVSDATPEMAAGDHGFRVTRAPDGGDIVQIRANPPVPPKGQPPGSTSEVVLRAKAVKAGDTTLYFDAETGEPIIPAGDEGFAEWQLLTGRQYGQDLGNTSLLQVFKGTKYEGEVQGLIDAFLKPEGDRAAAGKQVVGFLERLIKDASLAKTEGVHPNGPSAPANTNYGLQVRNGPGEVHDLVLSIGPDGQLRSAEILPPAPARLETEPPPAATSSPSELNGYDLTPRPDNGEPILFAQIGVSPEFSSKGRFNGADIEAIVEKLKSGELSPDDLPVQYIWVNGQKCVVNNRSLTTLSKAGKKPTVMEDMTGRLSRDPADPDSLDNVLKRLDEMGGKPSDSMPVRKTSSRDSEIREIVKLPM